MRKVFLTFVLSLPVLMCFAEEPETMDPNARAESSFVTVKTTKAATEKNAEDVFYLGMQKFDEGDTDGALKLLTEASEMGSRGAQFNLALFYLQGMGGFEKNPEEAAKWFAKAAENGDAEAQYQLGMMYYRGKGVEANQSRAIEYLKQALANGHQKAAGILEQIER